MSVYGNYINEGFDEIEFISESILLETIGLKKEDINSKEKVNQIAEKINDDKSTSFEKIKKALQVIALIIFIIPIGVTAPIWIPLMLIINSNVDKCEERKKDKAINMTINQYKKQIDRLNNQIKKETDPEKKKIYENSIKEFEKEIKNIEAKRLDENYAKSIKNGIDCVKAANTGTVFDCETAEELSLYLFYNDIDKSKFNKLCCGGEKKYIKDYIKKEESEELYNYFRDYINDKYIFFQLIDDTIFIYNIDKSIFFYGDWDAKYMNKYTYEELKNNYKKLSSFNSSSYWDEIVKADKYLGYNKLA